MKKEEIAFLMKSGFTLDEIMILGTSEQKAPEQTPEETPEQTPEETPEQPAAAGDQSEVIKALNDSLTSLKAEVEKLSGRIAAQGIKASAYETVDQSPEALLDSIAQKLNGGK